MLYTDLQDYFIGDYSTVTSVSACMTVMKRSVTTSQDYTILSTISPLTLCLEVDFYLFPSLINLVIILSLMCIFDRVANISFPTIHSLSVFLLSVFLNTFENMTPRWFHSLGMTLNSFYIIVPVCTPCCCHCCSNVTCVCHSVKHRCSNFTCPFLCLSQSLQRKCF